MRLSRRVQVVSPEVTVIASVASLSFESAIAAFLQVQDARALLPEQERL